MLGGEVDEGQVAAGHDDELGRRRLGVASLRPAWPSASCPRLGAGRLAARDLDRRVLGAHVDDAILGAVSRRRAADGAGHALGLVDLGQEGVDLAPVLDLGRGGRDRRLAAHQRADDVLERHAVALEERPAEALAVVGEDDEAIGTGRLGGDLLEDADLAVDAVERVERLGPLRAAVVGDLVVVGVVEVDDRRAAPHLLHHERGAERAEGDVGGRADPRVREAAMHARLDPRPRLAP